MVKGIVSVCLPEHHVHGYMRCMCVDACAHALHVCMHGVFACMARKCFVTEVAALCEKEQPIIATLDTSLKYITPPLCTVAQYNMCTRACVCARACVCLCVCARACVCLSV